MSQKNKGEFLINTLDKQTEKEGITLVCTFSRPIFVPFFFAALEKMDLPRKNIHLLVYDNTEDINLAFKLKEAIIPLTEQYLSVRLFKSYLKGKGSVAGSGNEIFKQSKLYNIWDMWRKIFKSKPCFIQTKLFFMLEDDTIAPPFAFRRLLRVLKRNPKIALVSGISTGRHPLPWIPVCLGVHKMKMRGFKVLERHSLSPFTKGVVEVDGTGVYCFVARTDAFLTGFDKYYPEKLNIPFFALDNVMIYNIKKHGYKILADFNVWVSHLEPASSRIIAFGKDQAVEMYAIWFPKANNYVQGLIVKKKNQKGRRYQVRKHAPSWDI